MSMVEYKCKVYELMPFSRFGDNLAQLTHHFIRGLNNHIVGGVKVFESKTLKDAIRQAILVEQSVNLRQGGFVGAPSSSGQKGNHNSGGNRKPSFPKGNQSQQ